jgi:hypothetical protein
MGLIATDTLYREILSVFNFDGETPLTGLSSSDFSCTFLYEDSIGTAATFSIVEIPGSGRYVASFTFSVEGYWTAFIDVYSSGNLLNTYQINVRVTNSTAQISIQNKGETLNNVGTLNFSGDVVVTEDAGIATIAISANPPAPDGSIDSSTVDTTIGGTSGTLTFRSRTT